MQALSEGTRKQGDAEDHAIFVGGGATRDGVIDACLAALRPAAG
ncbi:MULTISPECIES: hypothetical protein [unclassified Nocardioides]|nr:MULTISPECIES: hypothetical protein [unclassified Nocardioides]